MRSVAQTSSALGSLAALLSDEGERTEGDAMVTVPSADLRISGIVIV